MSQTLLPFPEVPAEPPSRCPGCRKPLTAKLVCWTCCERLCGRCGRPTGSAFLAICWPCWFQTEGRLGLGPPTD
jgi:hypothetical protein